MFNKSAFVGKKEFRRYQNAWYNNKKNFVMSIWLNTNKINFCNKKWGNSG
jgi:hypothetical protein